MNRRSNRENGSDPQLFVLQSPVLYRQFSLFYLVVCLSKAYLKLRRKSQQSFCEINSQNFCRSILPPEMIATIGPLPAFPLKAAATGKAPAPSAMTRAFSANSRIAFFVSSRVTTKQPSTMDFIRSHMRGNML